MEQNIKKERSLNRFFILFLAHAVLSFLCTTALWVCLLSASAYLGIVSPANTTEHAVSDWCASLDGQKTITPADIPAGAGYAFFDADGVYVEFFVKLPAKRGWQVGHFGKSRHLFLVQPPVDLPGAEFWLAHPDKFRFDLLFCQRLEVTLFHAVHRFFRTDMKNPSVSAASPVQVR